MKFKTEGSGKGDSYRPVNKKKYDENFDRIFGDHIKNHIKQAIKSYEAESSMNLLRKHGKKK